MDEKAIYQAILDLDPNKRRDMNHAFAWARDAFMEVLSNLHIYRSWDVMVGLAEQSVPALPMQQIDVNEPDAAEPAVQDVTLAPFDRIRIARVTIYLKHRHIRHQPLTILEVKKDVRRGGSIVAMGQKVTNWGPSNPYVRWGGAVYAVANEDPRLHGVRLTQASCKPGHTLPADPTAQTKAEQTVAIKQRIFKFFRDHKATGGTLTTAGILAVKGGARILELATKQPLTHQWKGPYVGLTGALYEAGYNLEAEGIRVDRKGYKPHCKPAHKPHHS